MANHQSAKKRARQSEKLKVHNKYFARTARNMIKILRGATDKTEATEMLPRVTSILDRLSKKNIIHANKAANLKSSLTVHVNKL